MSSMISYLTVWPTGQALPYASNLNLAPGRVVPNMVISQARQRRHDQLLQLCRRHTRHRRRHGLVPRVERLPFPQPVAHPRHARRQRCARSDRCARLSIDADGLCRGNVPSNAKAIVINVTAVDPTGGGYITVWPSGEARPESSNLKLRAGTDRPQPGHHQGRYRGDGSASTTMPGTRT
jgi:hypothetical protein